MPARVLFTVMSLVACSAVLADGALRNVDIFQLEVAADPQPSPDGRRIAFERRSMDIMSDTARSSIWLVAADGSELQPLASGTGSYSSPRWSPGGDRIAWVAAAEGRGAEIFVHYLATGRTALLTNLDESPSSIAWSPDGEWLAFAMHVAAEPPAPAEPPEKPEGADRAPPVRLIEETLYRADGEGYLEPGYSHLFVVPAIGGTPRQLTSGDYHHEGRLAWSPDGDFLYFSANRSEDWERDPVESELWRVRVADGELTALTGRDGPDYAPALSPDGRRIAWLGYDDRKLGYQAAQVHVMNVDGSGRRVLAADFDRSIDDVQWAGRNDRLLVGYEDHGRLHVAGLSLDGRLESLVNDVSGTSIGRPYVSGGFRAGPDGGFVYTRGDATRPADIARVDRRGQSRQLTTLNEDLLAHRTLGEVERIQWASSADGLPIEGWLVTPPDFDPNRDYPLILEIHGGPFAAYGPHFSAEIQLFAAAGYVVLYANPRGSTSYGADFANEIHHNYPGQDYDDLMSGVDAVLARGFVDEEQLFVTGGSGGGVLTAWIVGKTDRFAAAVSAKPVINWTSMTLTADITAFVSQYWFDGMPWEVPEAYWARSPLSLVGNVTTPTMLLTGEQDWRTPISESEQYYQALKLRGVDSALLRVPDASHGIAARPSHLIAKVDNILAWFARYRDSAGE